MKKIVLLLAIMLIPFSYSFEEAPLITDTSSININYEEDNDDLINTEKMKKSEKIEKAKENSRSNEKSKIKLDSRQLNHQRMLDYSTKQQNMMLPIF